MTAYIAPEVAAVIALHPYLRDPAHRSLAIGEQLDIQAQTIATAHCAGNPAIRMHVMCWWPDARGKSMDDILAGPFSLPDAHLTIAREYGFDDWTEVEALGNLTPDPQFETALDDMLAGDVRALTSRLKAHPTLATQQSCFGHRATLLHYIGANGVESHRQLIPLNAPALAMLLIDNGANTRAQANIYGGGQTPHALASTSAHPHHAGVSEALNAVLDPEV